MKCLEIGWSVQLWVVACIEIPCQTVRTCYFSYTLYFAKPLLSGFPVKQSEGGNRFKCPKMQCPRVILANQDIVKTPWCQEVRRVTFPCKQCLLQCYLRDDTGHPLQPACVSFEPASVSYHSPDTCHTRSLPSQGEKDNYEKPASGSQGRLWRSKNMLALLWAFQIPKWGIPSLKTQWALPALFHGSHSLLPVHQPLDRPRNVYFFQEILLVLPSPSSVTST